MERPRNIESTSIMTYGRDSPPGGYTVDPTLVKGSPDVEQPVRELGTAWKGATTERIECPACREMMEGCDCADLSSRLDEHMRTAHRGERYMERGKERIRGQ